MEISRHPRYLALAACGGTDPLPEFSRPMSPPTDRQSPQTAKARKLAEQRAKQAQEAAILLKQVTSPIRILILLSLAEGEKHVTGLQDALDTPLPNVSSHLTLLRRAGLVTRRRAGMNVFSGLSESGEALVRIIRTFMA
jgi:ArsR family transcriptional regulator